MADAGPRARPFWPHWTDGLHPALRPHVDGVLTEDGVELHDFAGARISSMVFGFNLLMPFRVGRSQPLAGLLSTLLGRALAVESVVFEFRGPGGILAELAGEDPKPREPFTASDAAVFVQDGASRGVVLVEVKLSENDFSRCNGATSRANRRGDVCASAAALWAEPSACYLRRPVRAQRDRRYEPIYREAYGSWEAAFPGADRDGPCPFVGDGQQPMRNLALGLGLVQAGAVDFAAHLLLHHDRNPDVPSPWDRFAAAAAEPALLPRLPASALVAALDDALTEPPAGQWLSERYRLAP